ncbi:MAG TPA: hypothetical protein VKZ51_08490 [Cyclobacteriaceae bacterium]|nr:hypothetical protein [Cyclobacteriaceae bacterium]
MHTSSPHKFHIPVMGLAFTIDSPVKVARYGISSAISIVEDNLVEMMRKYYYSQKGEPYLRIGPREENSRARRITDYLNLINRIVKSQVKALKASAFEAGSEIVKYFEMLPEDSPLKLAYRSMAETKNPRRRRVMEQVLRKAVKPGAIEVNIMTKIDKDNFDKNGDPIANGSDALAALRGYACSDLQNSAVVFSAGMNPRLFNYMETFEAFDAKGWGRFDKKVIVKVSDYRSAMIQGKYLAKKGIWVSEFRIESGLNCGGHAFATDGMLIGPILEEFRINKDALATSLFELYNPALRAKNKRVYDTPHPIKVTVQGGIGTFEEADFLHRHYGVSGTGWGTPFLLCPEATTVDSPTLELLSRAKEEDVVLSKNSPLGVRFHYLKGASGETEKLERIEKGSPGSPCTEKFLISNTEFTKAPICTASKKYQKLKIEQLKSEDLSEEEFRTQSAEVLSKECLCVGLSNSAAIKYEQVFVKKQNAVTICPGPNIAYFGKVVSLREMTDHIYGRANIIVRPDRPHMFLKELWLYLDYLSEQVAETVDPDKKFIKYCSTFARNLKEGIAYYRRLTEGPATASGWKENIKRSLADAEVMLALLTDRIQNCPIDLQDA